MNRRIISILLAVGTACGAPAFAASAGAEQFFAVADKLAPHAAWTVEDVADMTGAALNGTAMTRYDSSDIADRKPFRLVSVIVKPTKGKRWVRAVTLQLPAGAQPVPVAEVVAKYGPEVERQRQPGRVVMRRKHDWVVCNVDAANMVSAFTVTRPRPGKNFDVAVSRTDFAK